jgi:hypothetical protein
MMSCEAKMHTGIDAQLKLNVTNQLIWSDHVTASSYIACCYVIRDQAALAYN